MTRESSTPEVGGQPAPTGTNPRLSVIMNCLNCARYLREALNSAFAQTYRDWEIVFWDNASTDESGTIAQEYGEKVRYFRGSATVPLGQARNLALQQARGEYLAFLDCDDLWMPTKLEKQIRLFENDPAVGLVFSDTIFFKNGSEARSLFHKHKPPRGRVFGPLLANYFLPMEATIIRRSALESLSEWFDPRFSVAEEADVFLRLCFYSKADYVDEPLSKWRMHEGSETHRKFYLFAKENEMILEKLGQIVPNFNQDFAAEIAVMRRKIAFQKAVAIWQQGDLVQARHYLRPHLPNKRCLALYAATYLPQHFFNPIWDLYLRYRYLLG